MSESSIREAGMTPTRPKALNKKVQNCAGQPALLSTTAPTRWQPQALNRRTRNECAPAGSFAMAVSANPLTAAEGSTGG